MWLPVSWKVARTVASGRDNMAGLVAVILVLMTLPWCSCCPRECTCAKSKHGTVVDCRYQRLNALPQGFTTDTIEIDFGHNSITAVTKTTFPPLPNLEKLVMDWCQIEFIDADAFSHLSSLEYLQLSYNRINRIHKSAFRNLGNLRYLYLDYNKLASLPGEVFYGLRLDELMLHGNGLQVMNDQTFWGTAIVNLNLDENNISNISDIVLHPLKSSLKNFNLSYNQQPLTMDANVFSGFSFSDFKLSYCGLQDPTFLRHVSAQSLDISGQPFQRMDLRSYDNLRPTEELYLRNLSIDHLNVSLLGNLVSVKVLDLSQNKLVTFNGDVFQYTPNLEVLILNENQIVRLPESLGRHLSHLKMLRVAMNRLLTLTTDSFQGLSSLNALDIRYNKLQVISEQMKPLLNRMDILQMGGNPLHCNCEMRWFREWLDEYSGDTGADDCLTPSRGYIWTMEPSEFVCRSPQIQRITRSMNAREGDSIFLTCKAEGDPAPEVQWASPFGDVVSVTPPFNRTQHTTYAIWHLGRIKPHQGGWYTCTAQNVHSTTYNSIYIYVVTNGSSTIDVDSLTMPTTKPVTTTTTTPTTTTATTTLPTTTTTAPTTTTTTSAGPPTTTPMTSPTSTSVLPSSSTSTFAPNTTSVSTEASSTVTVSSTESTTYSTRTTITSGDVDEHVEEGYGGLPSWAVVVIITSIGGLCMLVVMIVILTKYCRRRKFVREYEVSPRSEPLANNNFNKC